MSNLHIGWLNKQNCGFLLVEFKYKMGILSSQRGVVESYLVMRWPEDKHKQKLKEYILFTAAL